MSVATSLFDRFLDLLQLVSRTKTKMHPFMTLLFSWRTLFFLLALLNLKNVPFSWHVRLFGDSFRHGRTPAQARRRLREAAAALKNTSPANKPLHPVFRPVSTPTHAPMFECDYNLHKSNSTYFSDLDVSRGNLVSSLIQPALHHNALVPYGIRKGLTYPILGSVHTSFLREIKPYESYVVRSRLLGWDRKWLVIGSWFVRPASKAELKKDKESGKAFLKGPVGEEEVVFAYVLNKYVVKAGRVTVPPELALAVSGWFPVRPEVAASMRKFQTQNGGAGAHLNNKTFAAVVAATPDTYPPSSTGTSSPALGPDKAVDSAANAVQNVAMEAGRRLSLSASTKPSITRIQDEEENEDEMPGWSWDEIDEENKRGLKIAETWLGLDVMLRDHYVDEMDRGIRHELHRK